MTVAPVRFLDELCFQVFINKCGKRVQASHVRGRLDCRAMEAVDERVVYVSKLYEKERAGINRNRKSEVTVKSCYLGEVSGVYAS